jgi:aquaporin Z
MKVYLAEFIGTFALVFAGTGAIIVDGASGGVIGHIGIALTFGAVVGVMVFALGDVSGAHINPAVTLSFWASGRFPLASVLPYILSQCLGAFAASLLLLGLFPASDMLGTTQPAGTAMQSFVFEIVLTFFLVLTILNVTTGAKEKGITAAIAIGTVIGLDAMFGGPVSGASMNPARSLAPAVVSGHLAHLWLHLLAPVIGGMLAVPCARVMHGK